jgi:aminoglycoside phosphotransferase family enzyme/predicted kinase
MEVVPITGSADCPVLGGSGPAIEYAVKMRRFPQSALFSEMLDREVLTVHHIDALAARIARVHDDASTAAAASPFGEPHTIEEPALQNFEQLGPWLKSEPGEDVLVALRTYTERAHLQMREVFGHRKHQGFVRECHGDLHLENIVWYDSDAMPFDCIEFKESLRWIDVMSDVAFIVTDLCTRGRPELGFRFLNAYLERTGDYGGLAVLRYYLVYRALVRAKVLALRVGEKAAAPSDEASQIRSYLTWAQQFAGDNRRAAIIITHGVSGSGKSTLTQHLLEALRAVRIRSDVERKRLAGLPSAARTGSALGEGAYTSQATHDTYAELERLAQTTAKAGYPAIVDAAFLRRDQRERFRRLAAKIGIPFVILDCRARETTLRARMAERERRRRDPSEADLAVLEHQLETHEQLAPDEQANAIAFDAEYGDCRGTARLLKTHLGEV